MQLTHILETYHMCAHLHVKIALQVIYRNAQTAILLQITSTYMMEFVFNHVQMEQLLTSEMNAYIVKKLAKVV